MLRTLLRRLRGGRSDADDGTAAEQPVESDGQPDADSRADDANSDGNSDADNDADDDADSDVDDDRNVWDLIPSWQYDGRHVEAGGLTRGEQEQALERIQRQAEAIEAREDDGHAGAE